MKSNGNQAVAAMAAIAGCINWNRFSEDQLQELQRRAQNSEDFSCLLQDWLEKGGWMNEAIMLDRLGYDVVVTLKRLHPELDELSSVTDLTDYLLTPMLPSDCDPYSLGVYYRDLEQSEPELFESCVGFQTLRGMAGNSDLLMRVCGMIKGYNPSETYRIFAPKSACMMRKNQPFRHRMPALIVSPTKTSFISFIDFIPYESPLRPDYDLVLRRNV